MKKKVLSALVSLASILALASCNFDFNIDGSAYHVEIGSDGNVVIYNPGGGNSTSTVSSTSSSPSISVKDGEMSLQEIYEKHDNLSAVALSAVVVKKTTFNNGGEVCLLVSDGYNYGTIMADSSKADFNNINENDYISVKGTVSVFDSQGVKWLFVAATSLEHCPATEKAPVISREPQNTYFEKDGKLAALLEPYLKDNTYNMPTQCIKVKGLKFDLSQGTGNGDFGHFTFPGTNYTGVVVNNTPSIPNDGNTYSADMYVYQGIKNTDGSANTLDVFIEKVYLEESTPVASGGFLDLINSKPEEGQAVDLSGALAAKGNALGYAVLSDGNSQVFLVDRDHMEGDVNIFSGFELTTYVEVKGNVVYDVFQNMLTIAVTSIAKLDGVGPGIYVGLNGGGEVKQNPIDIAFSQQYPALWSFNDGLGFKDANGISMIGMGGDASLRIIMKSASYLAEKAHYYKLTGFFGLSTQGWLIFIPSYVENKGEVDKITGMTYYKTSMQAGGTYAVNNAFTGCNGWIDGGVLRFLGTYSAEFIDNSNLDASGAEIIQYNGLGNYYVALKPGTVKMKIHFKYRDDGTEIISNSFTITITA
ncbi:MAG: hypothetical protein LKJ88_05515 [Bacilli bacterium]|jgi:hypothetical protein|nr:hypothetical protein [Bacilli bacterium]